MRQHLELSKHWYFSRNCPLTSLPSCSQLLFALHVGLYYLGMIESIVVIGGTVLN
jgi:hypothetical protein